MTRRIVLLLATLVLAGGAGEGARAEWISFRFTASDEEGRTLTARLTYRASSPVTFESVCHTSCGSEFSAGRTQYQMAFEFELDGHEMYYYTGKSREYSLFELYVGDAHPGHDGEGDSFAGVGLDVADIMNSSYLNFRFGLRSSDRTLFETHRRLPVWLDVNDFDVERSISIGVIRRLSSADWSVYDRLNFSGTIDHIERVDSGPVIPEPPALTGVLIGGVLVGGWHLGRRRKAA